MFQNKIIVAGGRDFNNYELLCEKLDNLLQNLSPDNTLIVTGMAKGADLLGLKYAEERGYLPVKFFADWDTHKKKAGFIRNEEMANYGTHLVAFWNGESKGTKHMIDIAKKKGLKVRVIDYVSSTGLEFLNKL